MLLGSHALEGRFCLLRKLPITTSAAGYVLSLCILYGDGRGGGLDAAGTMPRAATIWWRAHQ
jgi:hypothetical protein